MTKFFNYCITGFLLLLYIYSIRFTFLPVTGKIVIEGLGLFVFVFHNYGRSMPHMYIRFVLFSVLIVLWGFFTMFINGTSEAIYIQDWFIAPLAAFFGSYFIYNFSRKSIKDINSFFIILSLVVFVESVITIVIKFSPSFASLVASIQEFLLTEEDLAKGVKDYYRFAGLGMAVYFGVIPSCAIGVMTTVYLLAYSNSIFQTWYYSLVFIVISIVSFFVAKTSAMVVLLACLFYIYCLYRKKSFKMIGSVLFVGILLVLLFNYAMSYLPDNVYKWAFDVFIEKDLNTGSSGAVIDTWKQTEFELKTLIIGDARYMVGTHYYKGVDVGYYREIFYGGLVGLYLVLLFNYRIVKKTMKFAINKEMKVMLLCLYGSYLIALGKGDVNMVDVFILFFVFLYYKTRENLKFDCLSNNN